MEIVIRVDVLRNIVKEMGKRVRLILDYIFAFGITGAGILSFLYFCYCIFQWLAVA